MAGKSINTKHSAAAPSTQFSGDLAVYSYVRHQVTTANAGVDPTPMCTDNAHFDRLTRATDEHGRRIFSIDPRSVQWFFGCTNLPEGNVSISFGRQVYIAWDYNPMDPVATRLMAYELARIVQNEKAGGELAFARKHYRKSLSELFDCSGGRQSSLKRIRNAAVRRWRQWFETQPAAEFLEIPQISSRTEKDVPVVATEIA